MAERRPVLGVSACNRQFGGETAQVVANRYVEAAMRHGDVAALLIPALPDLMDADEVADRIDGLLLTGSPSNIDPARYGATSGDGPFDPRRDAMSLAMIAAMVRCGKPVFGICRGLQEINVACGGTLACDLGDDGRVLSHHAAENELLAPMFAHHHDVALAPGGTLSTAFGRDEITVNSVHYQGVDRLGDGLTVEARAPDGVIEAVAGTESPILAVQWHPEWDSNRDENAIAFFRLLGRVLRGEPLNSVKGEQD